VAQRSRQAAQRSDEGTLWWVSGWTRSYEPPAEVEWCEEEEERDAYMSARRLRREALGSREEARAKCLPR